MNDESHRRPRRRLKSQMMLSTMFYRFTPTSDCADAAVSAPNEGAKAQYVEEDRLISGRDQKLPSSLLESCLRVAMTFGIDDQFRGLYLRHVARQFFWSPVYRARLPLVRDAAQIRAEARGTTPEKEIEDATVQALALVEVPMTSPDQPFELQVRRQVNSLVTKDFLGNKWQRRDVSLSTFSPDGAELPTSLQTESSEEDDLAGLFASLINRAKLSPAEGDVIAAIRAGHTQASIARKRGVAESTVRNQYHSALRKLQIAARAAQT